LLDKSYILLKSGLTKLRESEEHESDIDSMATTGHRMDDSLTEARPRRGGCGPAAWMCCVCKYHNKTGKFTHCSNSLKEKCAGTLSTDEVSERPKSAVGGNHHRCEACYPSQFGVYVNGHGRQWPLDLQDYEMEVLKEDAEHELEKKSEKDFAKEVEKNKPSKVERDPLTWQRTGEWPV